MCIFVMKIPAMTKPYSVILLMNCVFLIPIGVAFFKALKQRLSKKIILFGLAFLLEVAGTGLTGYLWSQTKKPSIDLEEIWYPIVGVICLSIAWLPEIQPYLLKTNENNEKENTRPKRRRNYSYSSETTEAIRQQQESELADLSRDFSMTVDQSEAITKEPQVIVQDKPTWKMVIFLSFCKIEFTFVFSFFLLRFSIFSTEVSDVAAHFRIGWSDWSGDAIYYFIANCCSSLLGYIVGFIACTTCMQKGSYVLPLFLATPLAAVLLAVKNSCTAIVFAGVEAGDSEISNQCDLSGTVDMILFCVAVACLVLAHFLSFGILIINSPLLVKQSETQVRFSLFILYNKYILIVPFRTWRVGNDNYLDYAELGITFYTSFYIHFD